MFTTGLKKYLFIAKANIKCNLLPHIALSVIFLLLTPMIFGTANLDAKASALPLEMFTSLIGIVLLTPVFLPEQQKEIKELVESKYTGQNGVYIIRIISAVVIMLISISCFVLFMKQNNCEFDVLRYISGTFAGSMFLGSMGLFSYGISNNITLGYMVPSIYYVFNMFGGCKYLGAVYLFSMAKGSFAEKYWLFGAGLFIIVLTLCWKSKVRKTR